VSVELDRELQALRRLILTMCATTEARVNRSLRSIIDCDSDLAGTVRHGDREVDVMELEVEEEVLRILALHTPVAGDLRSVLAIFAISREFERMADLAKGIAKRVLEICREGQRIPWPDDLFEMVEAAQGMLADSNRAFSNRDVKLAEQVRRSDAFVDACNKRLIRWAIDRMSQHPEEVQTIVAFLSVLRAVERIGDQCTNVAEEVIFAVGGEVVRHSPVEQDEPD